MGKPQTPPLYGRGPLLGSLIPSLTGLAYDERARRKREFGDDVPVVLLTGQHGLGRSAVLDGLARHYHKRLPLAHVRVVTPGASAAVPAQSGGVPAAPAADFVQVLERIVCALAPGLGLFPVLLPGLFAVTGWCLGDADGRDAMCARHARLLIACGLLAGDERDVARQWSERVEASVAEAAGAAAAGIAVEDDDGSQPVTAAILRELQSLRGLAPARNWYGQRHTTPDGVTGKPDALLELGRRFHRGGDYQHAVENTLMAAFLEEVADTYGLVRHLNREPWPLILLDEAHAPAGQRFLNLLLEHRAVAQRPHRDRITVVATRLGDVPQDEAPQAVRRELADLLPAVGGARRKQAAAIWQRTGHDPSAGLLVVPLTPLGRDDVLSMLDRASARLLHPHLASALHSLTGGHPAAGTALCDAVVHAARQNRTVTPRDLLDLPTAQGRPVTQVLLEDLLPDRRQRDRLLVLCLARDNATAEALAEDLRLDGPEQLPANAAAQYLVERQWQQSVPVEAPLVESRLLQSLLVHEARRTSPPPDDPHSWHQIHRFLHLHHVQRSDTEEADALRHSLAAGNAAQVVDMLADEFGAEEAEQSVQHWLFCLRHCATAPTPPSAGGGSSVNSQDGAGGWSDHRVEIALGEYAARYTHLDEAGRSINRLLHALWYLSEPYADAAIDPDAETLCQAVGDELGFLSRRHRTWYAALGRAARDWPVAARRRKVLPVPASEGS
ncbi:ATP-binding protein [Streptomyces sp. NBC_01381]|uniref:ATP-binding protein n=1 Tax=Streptomyces sp. NBC_01381 TaxID=2903845 RepID=UPI00225970D7|nr:ATP-binding protein [Streptomyces sp. NBC_01381]MCX4670670.1 ATP-binding protein [Streptomyces sp. NBC_01381]